MSVVLNTVDQVLGAAKSAGPQLSFAVDRITAREIVRSRVLMEVDRYNSNACTDHALSLIFPPKEEHALNGPRRLQPRPLNAERQIEVALEAIRKGRIVIMFNACRSAISMLRFWSRRSAKPGSCSLFPWSEAD